jgi:hypothetical protein
VKNQGTTVADARRVQIATSVAAGQSIAATARQLGISREWASRIANAPETQQIITLLVQAHAERMCDLFDAGLKVIKDAFRARRKALRKGEVVDLGPDHYARLAAFGRLLQMLTAGGRCRSRRSRSRRAGIWISQSSGDWWQGTSRRRTEEKAELLADARTPNRG